MYVFAGLESVPLQTTTGEFALAAFMVAALVVTVIVTVFLAFSPYLSGTQSVHAPSVDEDHAGEFRSEASANDSSEREDAAADKNEARTEGDPGESG